jgi:hypothetical protein
MTDYNSSITYYPSNYNRLFNDKSFVSGLITLIKSKLGRQLYRTEKAYIINVLKNIDPVIFTGKNNKTILDVLSTKISEDIIKNPCGNEDNDINIHEMLKTQIGVSTEDDTSGTTKSEQDFTTQITSTFNNQVDVVSLLGNKTLADLQKLINPGLVKRTISIILDTRYRILDNDGTTYFRWNFNNNEITTQGTVNAIGNIRDITSIRIFPIRLPYNSHLDNDYDRVTIFIQEFSAQAFIAQENRRFHFIFSTSTADRWINLEPESFNDGYFRFRTPITRLDTLTLTLGSPLEQVVFDTDRMLANVTTYATTTEFTTVSPHILETGDRVYISNFSTANINTDTVFVSAINRTSGHLVTVTGASTFKIDIDSSSIRILGAGTVDVTNGSPIVLGSGTSFGSMFNTGDAIEISGINYPILSINTQSQLTLAANYSGTTASGLTYYKNNTLTGMRPTIYFGSKRIFFPMEIEFYDTESPA